MPDNNVEIYKQATEFMAMREQYTFSGEDVKVIENSGLINFHDLFWGGEDNVTMRDSILTLFGPENVDRRQNMGAMTVQEIQVLANRLQQAGQIGNPEHALMGLKVNPYPFADDVVFRKSPIALFPGAFNLGGTRDRSLDWIRAYENQLRFLIDNGADAQSMESTANILEQLKLQKTERALYDAYGFGNEDDDFNQRDDLLEGLINRQGVFIDLFKNNTETSIFSNNLFLAQQV